MTRSSMNVVGDPLRTSGSDDRRKKAYATFDHKTDFKRSMFIRRKTLKGLDPLEIQTKLDTWRRADENKNLGSGFENIRSTINEDLFIVKEPDRYKLYCDRTIIKKIYKYENHFDTYNIYVYLDLQKQTVELSLIPKTLTAISIIGIFTFSISTTISSFFTGKYLALIGFGGMTIFGYIRLTKDFNKFTKRVIEIISE